MSTHAVLCACGCGLPPISDPVARIVHDWGAGFPPNRFSGHSADTAKIAVTPEEVQDLADRVAAAVRGSAPIDTTAAQVTGPAAELEIQGRAGPGRALTDTDAAVDAVAAVILNDASVETNGRLAVEALLAAGWRPPAAVPTAAETVTEWGVRWPDGPVEICLHEQHARGVASHTRVSVVSRTATHSPWVAS